MAYTLLWATCNATCLITYLFHIMIAPFYPDEALRKGVSMITVGYVFSAYPIANLITSLSLIHLINRFSKKTIVIMS